MSRTCNKRDKILAVLSQSSSWRLLSSPLPDTSRTTSVHQLTQSVPIREVGHSRERTERGHGCIALIPLRAALAPSAFIVVFCCCPVGWCHADVIVIVVPFARYLANDVRASIDAVCAYSRGWAWLEGLSSRERTGRGRGFIALIPLPATLVPSALIVNCACQPVSLL